MNAGRQIVVCLALLAAATAAPQAWSYPIIFATGPTATLGGALVNAQASFTFNVTSQTITIQLLNLQLNPAGVTQLISGVEFDLTNLNTGTLSSSISTAIESSFNIGNNGAPTANQQASSWITQNIGTSSVSLCEICKLGGGGGPEELVIGGPDPSTGNLQRYTAAGGGIAGNGPHNPFILGSGVTYTSGPLQGLISTPTWVLNVPLITAGTGIGEVRFFFGTSYDTNFEVPVDDFTAPEPGPLVLIASGLLLVAGARLSRRWRR